MATSRPRWAGRILAEALLDTPVVALNGARQVGKSTLVASLDLPGTKEVVSFDDEAVRRSAQIDPRGFLGRAIDTLIIDEAQLVPAVFRAIKAEVDRDRRPGRFLITGSSRLLAAPDMADSLVGRVEVVELWPFSQGEIDGIREDFVTRMFSEPASFTSSPNLTREELAERICRGGFPEAQHREGRRRSAWFDNYTITTIEKVVRELAEIERLAEMPRLLRLCATRTSAELNTADISNELGIPARTGSAYIARLASAFLVQLTPAWSTNLSAKVVRKPKLSVVDSGLAAHLVGATPASLLKQPDRLGALLETFVSNEIRRQLSWSDTRATMWHFRDRSGAEVDIVLEAPNGDIAGIEVKATASPGPRDFKGLAFLRDRLGARFRYGVVMCTAPEALPMGDRLAAIPVDCLWR